MSGSGKTSVVGIWMVLMILCLVMGEVYGKSCEVKCLLKCGVIFFKCFEDCVDAIATLTVVLSLTLQLDVLSPVQKKSVPNLHPVNPHLSNLHIHFLHGLIFVHDILLTANFAF